MITITRALQTFKITKCSSTVTTQNVLCPRAAQGKLTLKTIPGKRRQNQAIQGFQLTSSLTRLLNDVHYNQHSSPPCWLCLDCTKVCHSDRRNGLSENTLLNSLLQDARAQTLEPLLNEIGNNVRVLLFGDIDKSTIENR